MDLNLSGRDLHFILLGNVHETDRNRLKLFSAKGNEIRKITRVLPYGIAGHVHTRHGDMPPGLYRVGKPVSLSSIKDRLSMGSWFIPLLDLRKDDPYFHLYKKTKPPFELWGRVGIGYHGEGRPDPFHPRPKQALNKTEGCCRGHNQDVTTDACLILSALSGCGKIYWETIWED